MQEKSIVLVTGASGFIGGHCVLALLNKGYAVRAVVRSKSRIEKCKAVINAHYPDNADVEYALATLDSDDGWDAAVNGCEYVLHLASPLPIEQPKDPNELIIPARDGALRVLTAASRAGVKRVVMTSSQAAVCGSPLLEKDYIYDEKDWTDLNNKTVTPYNQSKTIAERSAWDFVNKENSIELVTVCPGLVFGPVLEARVNTSLEFVRRLMDGSLPLIPPVGYEVVDVRDVTDLHLLAMEKPNGAGGRFMASAGFMWLHEMAATLRSGLGEEANKVPTLRAPAWFIRLLALFDPAVGTIVPELNQCRRVSHETSTRELGWIPRSPDEAVIATAKSLLAYGIFDDRGAK
ncbi:MAG: aldehyde reductase [Xenococcaceae cyanobacterium MO_207.B15]|nr:aldehyde reductase [Xenococcaceae cyanobacterium MO_207.B15]